MDIEIKDPTIRNLVSASGDINAGSKRELLHNVNRIAQAHALSRRPSPERTEKRKLALAQAFASPQAQQALGGSMATELSETGDREGFMRNILLPQTIAQGEMPQARMKMKNMVAVISSSPSKIETRMVRDQHFNPPEFYLSSRCFVEQRDIDRSKGDILEERFIDSQTAHYVAEDRIFLKMARAAADQTQNNVINFYGNMTPQSLGDLRNQVASFGLSASTWLIANNLWTDLLSDSGFQSALDPVTKYDLVTSGQLGTILGMRVISDAFRHPQHKVLQPGESFVFANPDQLGQYTDRGLSATPIGPEQESVPGRGWFLNQTLSILLANVRGVSRGIRR